MNWGQLIFKDHHDTMPPIFVRRKLDAIGNCAKREDAQKFNVAIPLSRLVIATKSRSECRELYSVRPGLRFPEPRYLGQIAAAC